VCHYLELLWNVLLFFRFVNVISILFPRTRHVLSIVDLRKDSCHPATTFIAAKGNQVAMSEQIPLFQDEYILLNDAVGALAALNLDTAITAFQNYRNLYRGNGQLDGMMTIAAFLRRGLSACPETGPDSPAACSPSGGLSRILRRRESRDVKTSSPGSGFRSSPSSSKPSRRSPCPILLIFLPVFPSVTLISKRASMTGLSAPCRPALSQRRTAPRFKAISATPTFSGVTRMWRDRYIWRRVSSIPKRSTGVISGTTH
jgi:hypothetical protein